MEHEVLHWLMDGDAALRYQVCRDLLGRDEKDLQQKISREGWGKQFLDARNPDGTWGRKYYQPKWTCTHYALLDMSMLNLSPDIPSILPVLRDIAVSLKAKDGGINPARTVQESDLCISGMFLCFACWFGLEQKYLISIVDLILHQHMQDGGFNCMGNRYRVKHSSMHTTISVLEGILAYHRGGYQYRNEELEKAALEAEQWLLQHRLFKSDRTGSIIHRSFLSLFYPYRWRYTILRALDYFRAAGRALDGRMENALEVLLEKRRRDGRWPVHAPPKGKVFFAMEQPGEPSRWITLIALRVLLHFGKLPEFTFEREEYRRPDSNRDVLADNRF